MNTIEVLILHGSPGSGKTTQGGAVAEQLRQATRPHAVIDLDDIGIIPPPQGRGFSHQNLKSIWPNYTVIPDLKVIIPTVIADADDYRSLTGAMTAAKIMICELTAPVDVLKERVTVREPNEYWQDRLQNWVDVYQQRDESQSFGDFSVSTDGRSIEDTAKEIVAKAGWTLA